MAEYQTKDQLITNSKIREIKNKKNLNQNNFSFFQPKATRRLKVPLDTKLIFFRQFSVILQSGISLTQGLELLSENISNVAFSECIQNIASSISSGKDLSNSLKDYPRVFDSITIGLIEAGEAGGVLSEVLDRIASLLESKSKIRGQITGALIYPVILLVLALTVSLGLLIFINFIIIKTL